MTSPPPRKKIKRCNPSTMFQSTTFQDNLTDLVQTISQLPFEEATIQIVDKKTKKTERKKDNETPIYENVEMTVNLKENNLPVAIFRIYNFYCLFASFIFRKVKVFERERIFIFDEINTNTKATKNQKETKDTFLVAVSASGRLLPVSIVKSNPGEYSIINGNRVPEKPKVSGVHVSHIKKWLTEVYLPNSNEGDLLIWDNASHHKSKDIQQILKEHKRLNVLVPLGGHPSPMDNMCFCKAKQLLSNWKKEHDTATRDERNQAFLEILQTLSEDLIVNSFKKCIVDFWNFSTEEEYLFHVRKELKMDNAVYELYLRQIDRFQFYICHNVTTTKVENENSEELDADSKNEPFSQEKV